MADWKRWHGLLLAGGVGGAGALLYYGLKRPAGTDLSGARRQRPPVRRTCRLVYTKEEIRDLRKSGFPDSLLQAQTCTYRCIRPFKAARFQPQGKPGEFAILHPSTKVKGKWQLSLFDKDGPWGDRIRDTCTEAAQEMAGIHKEWYATDWE